MESLANSLETRLEEKFYGSHARMAKNHMDTTTVLRCFTDFNEFYENALIYLKNHFDYSENNYLKKLEPLSLNCQLTFEVIARWSLIAR